MLARPANLLVLDEPTNDLDMETLDLLQELVSGFAGTVILVSHDRDFLDRTVTSVLAPDSGGRWIEYAGGYSDMLAQRGGNKLDERKVRARAASDEPAQQPQRSAEPQRPTARKLSYKQRFAGIAAEARMEAAAASIAAGSGTARPRLFPAIPPPSADGRRSGRTRRPCGMWSMNGWSWRCCARRSRDSSG